MPFYEVVLPPVKMSRLIDDKEKLVELQGGTVELSEEEVENNRDLIQAGILKLTNTPSTPPQEVQTTKKPAAPKSAGQTPSEATKPPDAK